MKKQNIWQVITFIFVALFLVALFTKGFSFSGITGRAISENEAKEKALNFIKNNLINDPSIAVEITDIIEESGVYKITLSVGTGGLTQEATSYISKDGKLFFINGVNIEELTNQVNQNTQDQTIQQVPKSDKPLVELFVMSHCPYGTQAEKGIIPVFNLLGNKIDSSIKFVYYAMHGETEVLEQLNQYCIQKEQNDKYLDYLTCFLKEGNGENCLKEAEIDINKLNICTEKADKEFEIIKNLEDQSSWLNGRYPLFNLDKALNDKYSVGGSPTLVINGEVVSSGRDSASYLSVICEAFNDAPEECSKELSTQAYGPGFGYSISEASTTEAQCG